MKKKFQAASNRTIMRFLFMIMFSFLMVINSLTVNARTLTGPEVNSNVSKEDHYVTTWNTLFFGSYPQTEIVDQTSTCGTYGKSWAVDSDCVEDSDLYTQLSEATDWDSNGDITIDGTKYRRIQRSDASAANDNENVCYEWGNGDVVYRYFRYEPIRWRVLEVKDSQALLVSDVVLDSQSYHINQTTSLTWAQCTLRSWLNGYNASSNSATVDYSSGKNFINTAFSSEESEAIIDADAAAGTELDTADKVFILSYDQMRNPGYGFNAYYGSWKAESSTYAKGMGNVCGYNIPDLGCSYWWMRTIAVKPYTTSEKKRAMYVPESGMVYDGYDYAQKVESPTYGVRPALYLDLNSSVWKDGCIVRSDGTVFDEHVWNKGEITTPAGCNETGIKTYTCRACGETKTEVIPSAGHSWNEGVITKEATCSKAGVKTYTCINCKNTKTKAIPATGKHKAVTDKAVAATVFATGKTAGSHCSVCGSVITAQKTVAKLKPTIKLSAANKTLKVKKSYTLVISNLAKGDSIKTVKSSKTTCASVKKISNTKYKITAKKKGSASVTVTLKSGKTAKCKITVK